MCVYVCTYVCVYVCMSLVSTSLNPQNASPAIHNGNVRLLSSWFPPALLRTLLYAAIHSRVSRGLKPKYSRAQHHSQKVQAMLCTHECAMLCTNECSLPGL